MDQSSIQTMLAPASLPALPICRGRTPFRVGVTSYVYPADILLNVSAVAAAVDDVELVFFESGGDSNLPSPALVRRLRTLQQMNAITSTVHFPIDRALGSPEAAERNAMLDQVLRLIELCGPLDPCAWLLHLEGIAPDASPPDVARWQDRIRPLLARIVQALPDPQRLCIENLGYPFEWCDALISEIGLSVCLDAGHFWRAGHDWRAEAPPTRPWRTHPCRWSGSS